MLGHNQEGCHTGNSQRKLRTKLGETPCQSILRVICILQQQLPQLRVWEQKDGSDPAVVGE